MRGTSLSYSVSLVWAILNCICSRQIFRSPTLFKPGYFNCPSHKFIFYRFSVTVIFLALGGPNRAIFLLLLGPLLLLQRARRVIYTLLALEFLRLAALIFIFSSQQTLALGVRGLLLVLSCLIIEARAGIGLLVSLLRWGSKLNLINS